MRNDLDGDPRFYSTIFEKAVLEDRSSIGSVLDLPSEYPISFLIDKEGIQDSLNYRSMQRSVKIAQAILDDKGDLVFDRISSLILSLESSGYIPLPGGYTDREFTLQALNLLHKLLSNKGLQSIIRRCQLPLANLQVEQMVKDCLCLPLEHELSQKDVRIALVSACFYPLRQTVGSCFATAPAILIQKEQVENLIQDLIELLSTGKMARVISGKQYSVPLSPSYGLGNLTKKLSDCSISLETIPLGLQIPLEMVGIILKEWTADELSVWYQKKLNSFFSSYMGHTINDFFEFIVLGYFGVTKEELERFAIQQQSFFKHSKQVSIIQSGHFSNQYNRCETAQRTLARIKHLFLSMTEHLLARAWEYTLASFSEVKMDFSRWHLYASLGLNPHEASGIGSIIYLFIEKKIASCNQHLELLQRDYEIAFDQLRATEILLKQASSDAEARRLQAEFHSRNYHLQACLNLRDRFYKKASFYPELLNFLNQQFDEQFPEYFQEIYDPEMQELKPLEYEDSPAGFRLVYKHGRRDASLWTMIYNQQEFIEALVGFFSFIEPHITAEVKEKDCHEEMAEVFSLIISHIRTEEFIVTAFERTKKRDQQLGLHNKDPAAEKTPWAYRSGGVMATLINTYYRRQVNLYEESFQVDGALDLLTALIEAMKSLPYNFTVYFPYSTQKRMLVHSPTHAFLLLPYHSSFFKAWDNNEFTYTWIRDQVLIPSKVFFRSQILSLEDQETLLDLFAKEIADPIAHNFLSSIAATTSISLQAFTHKILKCFPMHPLIQDRLASFLYQALPLTPGTSYKKALYALLEEKTGPGVLQILQSFPDLSGKSIPAYMLRDWAKACYLLFEQKVCFDFDLHKYIADQSIRLSLSPPSPFLFADTNWSVYSFGFVVSPISEELELWRVKEFSFQGSFMRSWSDSFIKRKGSSWSMYAKPQEYATVFEKVM